MIRRNSDTLLAIIVGIFFLSCVSIFSSVYIISNAYAQEKTSTGGSDKIKTMLLRSGGWIVEQRGASEGVVDFIFEERGENIVVKIHNAAWNVSCERNVTITSDVIKLDGRNDTNVSLRYDPNDQKYPFKGESPKVNYKLKAK